MAKINIRVSSRDLDIIRQSMHENFIDLNQTLNSLIDSPAKDKVLINRYKKNMKDVLNVKVKIDKFCTYMDTRSWSCQL